MSSDRKEPGSTWQEPTNSQTGWQQSAMQEQALDEDVAPQQMGAYQSGTPFPIDEDDTGIHRQIEPDLAIEAASSPLELLKNIGQYVALIFVPLLFGALTSLLTLPAIASHNAYLPPASFWPILIIILVVTIAQGVAVYMTSDNQGLWLLTTLTGFCLFLLLTCLSLYGPIAMFLVLIAASALGVYIVRQCVHLVPEGVVDIVYALHKYRRTLYPGFNILLPWEKIQTHLNTQEVQWLCPEQVIQLSREDDVALRGVIAYQIVPEDAHLAITQFQNWEESLRNLFMTSIHTVVAAMQYSDFLIWQQGIKQPRSQHLDDDDFQASFERRNELNTFLFNLIRDKVALWGVQINWVSLRNIELVPHGLVRKEATPAATAPAVQESPTANAATVDIPNPKATAKTAPATTKNITPQPQPPLKQPAYTTPLSSPIPSQVLPEDVLIEAYKQVQQGRITDPETIRGIAANFEAVANDPQTSQEVSFDPARAALNLYDQALKYEESYARYEGEKDKTEADWVVARGSEPPKNA